VGIESIFPRTVLRVLGLPIRDTVVQTWLIMAILLGLALATHRRYRALEPRRWQLAVEWVVEYVEQLVQDLGGRAITEVVPYLTTMLCFIALSNLFGLVPFVYAPTRDLNTTLALALFSLASCQFYGIKRRGFMKYLRSFVEPVAIMLPLNLLGQLSRTLAMALRLFGNVLAGEMIGGVMFLLLPFLGPLPLNLLGMITGVLQALVFTTLTFVFVVEAMGGEEISSAEVVR